MPELRYEVYKGLDICRAADVALKNRLYVSGWELSYLLKKMRMGRQRGFIVLCFNGETPIGVLAGKSDGFIMVFVRKSERRKGIGSKLVEKASLAYDRRLDHEYGIDGSEDFFYEALKKIDNHRRQY